MGLKRVRKAFKRTVRSVERGFGSLGRFTSYLWSPKRSVIYGKEGYTIGHGIRSGKENLKVAGQKIGYWGSSIIGREKDTSIGKAREGAQQAETARQVAAAQEGARMSEAQRLAGQEGATGKPASRKRRGPVSTMYAGQFGGNNLGGPTSSLG